MIIAVMITGAAFAASGPGTRVQPSTIKEEVNKDQLTRIVRWHLSVTVTTFLGTGPAQYEIRTTYQVLYMMDMDAFPPVPLCVGTMPPLPGCFPFANYGWSGTDAARVYDDIPKEMIDAGASVEEQIKWYLDSHSKDGEEIGTGEIVQ